MLRKGLHIVFVAAMYVLLLFGTTSREFVHSFTGHEDTVHHTHAPGEYSFESEHHHCDFLNYSIPDINNDISYPYVAVMATSIHPEYRSHEVHFVQCDIIQTSLRGPPAFLS